MTPAIYLYREAIMTHYDTILAHGLVVTMDSHYTLIPDGAVAIRGSQIVAVGRLDEVLAEAQVDQVVDCRGAAIIPGLVNAHTHAPMTLLRGLADDLRLDVWLHGYMMPVERQFVDPDFCRLGTRLACAEMIRSGVTCFADMYYYEQDVAATAAEVGMRAICAETILKFPAPGAPTYEDSLAYSRDFIIRWREHPLIRPAVGPHAPYTATPEMLAAAVGLAREFDVPLLIHLSESSHEVQEGEETWEMSPIRWVREQGLFEAKVVAAHCVHVDEAEMRILARAGAGVIHDPTSNLKFASGVAPVPRMLELGIQVGIGEGNRLAPVPGADAVFNIIIRELEASEQLVHYVLGRLLGARSHPNYLRAENRAVVHYHGFGRERANITSCYNHVSLPRVSSRRIPRNCLLLPTWG